MTDWYTLTPELSSAFGALRHATLRHQFLMDAMAYLKYDSQTDIARRQAEDVNRRASVDLEEAEQRLIRLILATPFEDERAGGRDRILCQVGQNTNEDVECQREASYAVHDDNESGAGDFLTCSTHLEDAVAAGLTHWRGVVQVFVVAPRADAEYPNPGHPHTGYEVERTLRMMAVPTKPETSPGPVDENGRE